jgi:hypothetical protein
VGGEKLGASNFEIGGLAGTRGRKVGWTTAEPSRFHGIDQSVEMIWMRMGETRDRVDDGMVVGDNESPRGWWFGADSYGQTRELELQSSITSKLDNSSNPA